MNLEQAENSRRMARKQPFLNATPCYIVLNQNNDQVLSFIKNKQAFLFQTPNPETGYFFEDIVEVEGPIGQRLLRDDSLNQYRALRIIDKSNLDTFHFKLESKNKLAITDYFRIESEFQSIGFNLQLSDLYKQINTFVFNGWCSAKSIEQVNNSLRNSNIQIQDLIISIA